ncbi:MAG TPA: hypothetical protein VNK96_05395 [Fimbriimonadales bacterium]|nr:hypothetical protein [Fimbriimonadales bacterium]
MKANNFLPATILISAAFLLAGGAALLGLEFDTPLVPTIYPRQVYSTVESPLSPAWDDASFVDLATLSPGKPSRVIRVRALQTSDRLFLLAEWDDATKDMSFQDSTYRGPGWLPEVYHQSTVLLRDELEVRFAQVKTGGTYERIANGRWQGSWVWKSQWQQDADSKMYASIKERYPRNYVDVYPFVKDAAYMPARALENTNALTDGSSAAHWFAAPPKGRFGQPKDTNLFGRGVWNAGKWHVMFSIPLKEIDFEKGNCLEIVFAISDGRLGEKKGRRGISEPVRILLSKTLFDTEGER